MHGILKWLALSVLAVGIGIWITTGRQTGFWTKTSRQIEQIDPVTEIHYTKEIKGFYPGVDWLVATACTAAALAGGSYFLRKKV